MRLLVARCEVLYTGQLMARLPEAIRLLMFKADGSFLVHDDAAGIALEQGLYGYPTPRLGLTVDRAA
jgi:RecB family endonuclease NucS